MAVAAMPTITHWVRFRTVGDPTEWTQWHRVADDATIEPICGSRLAIAQYGGAYERATFDPPERRLMRDDRAASGGICVTCVVPVLLETE